MADINKLLFELACAPKPTNEAEEATISLFRTISECERCRRGDPLQYVTMSQPEESK